jgi:VWFA-related protein
VIFLRVGVRELAVLLTLAGFMLPAFGEKRLPVAELEQILASASTQPDAKLADQLADLELTQRLSSTTLTRLQSLLPGPQSQQELSILAAQASFLDLPPAEMPALPTPGVAEQRQIMAAVVNYVTQTTRKLPDFIATRQTRTFEDRPAGAYSYLPLHFTTETTANVVYRGGEERDTDSKGKKIDTVAAGLVSWGEFGPILSTVLLDAAKSQLAWRRWEQDLGEPVAVFRYAVPARESHYQIQFCCVSDWDPGSLVSDSVSGHLYHKQAPYHGEMSVDPSTGAIHRITVIADLGPGDPLVTASIAVQYGPIDIGGKTYVCPIRSEAIAQRRLTQNRGGAIPSTAISQGPIWTRLNEVSFTQYHIYRGQSRILTDAEAAQMTGQPVVPPAEPPSDNRPGESQSTQTTAGSQPSQPAAEPQHAAAPQPAPADLPAPGTPPQPSVSTSAPPQPALAESAPPVHSADIPVFRTTTRQILVDVIVDKKNGDPVSGLPKSDFSVNEDGKPQAIDFFEEHSPTASAPVGQPAMPPLPPGALNNVPTASPSAALYVFLLDSLNSEPQDQVFIHDQVLAFLRKMDPGTQVAVFSLGARLRLLHGFSSDSAALFAAVEGKSAERDAMAQNRSDNADDAAHIANLQAMRASPAAIEARQAADAAAHGYSFGARATMTFEALNALARYLEGIPGRKNLIWFSSSFPVVFFPTPSEMDHLKNNPNLPGYLNRVRQTANLFTLSKIAVYPVSGAGLAASNVGIADSAGSGRAGGSNGTGAFVAESLNSASAHTSMEQLASSTGGRAFTTNDIDAALRSIVHDSDVYYTVGYSPSGPAADGGFRRIDVKVNGGKYKLAYRQGYNADSDSTDGAPSVDPIAPLLQSGLPNATGILYGASAAPGTEQGSEPAGQNAQIKGPLTRYTISFTVRAQDILFAQGQNGRRMAKLVIGVKAYRGDGSALNWQATREAVELDDAHYQSALKSGIPISIALDLPANASGQIVTAVYDWNTNRSGTLEIPLPR